MPRKDIWKNGVKTRFSAINQPAGRGRPKGKSKAKVIAKWLGALLTAMPQLDEQRDNYRRQQRNARRRELYRQRERPGNDFGLPVVSFPAMEPINDFEKFNS